jgi:predicted transcriptional regulator
MADEVSNQQQGEGQNGETPATPESTPPVTFDAVYGALAPEQRGVIDGHIGGLKSALKDERDGRKALEKQLRDLSKQAEEGSALRTQLDKLAEEQSTTSAKAMFFEQAHDAQVRNLRLAWLAAQEYGLVDAKTGEADFAKLRQQAPELFAPKPVPSANAGAGAKQPGVNDGRSMNDFIRAAAGRGR